VPKGYAAEEYLVSLILQCDEDWNCTEKVGLASRPIIEWRGRSRSTAAIVLGLTQGFPEEGMGRYPGWYALHICGSPSEPRDYCLNWRHLYWGTPRENARDAHHGCPIDFQDTRLPKSREALAKELFDNRRGYRKWRSAEAKYEKQLCKWGWGPAIRIAAELEREERFEQFLQKRLEEAS
jgi:hypothetical protein